MHHFPASLPRFFDEGHVQQQSALLIDLQQLPRRCQSSGSALPGLPSPSKAPVEVDESTLNNLWRNLWRNLFHPVSSGGFYIVLCLLWLLPVANEIVHRSNTCGCTMPRCHDAQYKSVLDPAPLAPWHQMWFQDVPSCCVSSVAMESRSLKLPYQTVTPYGYCGATKESVDRGTRHAGFAAGSMRSLGKFTDLTDLTENCGNRK